MTELSYNRIYHDPHFFGSFHFSSYLPVEKASYTITVPVDMEIAYTLFGDEKEKVKFIPEYIPNSTYGKEKPASYVIDKSKYYISMPDGLTEFPKKKSELLKLFPNNQVSIESFLTDKKISFSQESNLIELIDFLNTL